MTQLQKVSAVTAISQELLAELEHEAGSGLEQLTSRDYMLPFLAVLQGLSPQLDRQKAQYVPGAEQGDIYNPATGELFKAGVDVVPVQVLKVWNEWKTNRGGFVRSYESLEDAENQRDTNNDLIETQNWFVLIKGAEDWTPAIFSLKSTGLKAARQWATALSSVRLPNTDKVAPVYATGWHVVPKSITKNHPEKGSITYYNLTFQRIPGWTSDKLIHAARNLQKLIKEGKARADESSNNEGAELERDLVTGNEKF